MAFTAKILSWPFRHLNILGCLLKRRPTKGGSRAPQDPPPPSYAPVKHCTRHTCGDEHSAALYYIQTVVSNALIQAEVFAVDDSKLQSIGFDTYSVIISEFFSILQPGDAGFWFTRHLTRHDVTRR